MKWFTRSHVHVDRVACPWLITRFIDNQAEFLFVPKNGTLAMFDVQRGAVKKVGQGLLAASAHSVSVDQTTHRVYVPLENVNRRPVLRILEPVS